MSGTSNSGCAQTRTEGTREVATVFCCISLLLIFFLLPKGRGVVKCVSKIHLQTDTKATGQPVQLVFSVRRLQGCCETLAGRGTRDCWRYVYFSKQVLTYSLLCGYSCSYQKCLHWFFPAWRRVSSHFRVSFTPQVELGKTGLQNKVHRPAFRNGPRMCRVRFVLELSEGMRLFGQSCC